MMVLWRWGGLEVGSLLEMVKGLCQRCGLPYRCTGKSDLDSYIEGKILLDHCWLIRQENQAQGLGGVSM
jgi:hypothetical protein